MDVAANYHFLIAKMSEIKWVPKKESKCQWYFWNAKGVGLMYTCLVIFYLKESLDILKKLFKIIIRLCALVVAFQIGF